MLGIDSNQSRVRGSDGTNQPGPELSGGARCYNIAVVGCLFPAGLARRVDREPVTRQACNPIAGRTDDIRGVVDVCCCWKRVEDGRTQSQRVDGCNEGCGTSGPTQQNPWHRKRQHFCWKSNDHGLRLQVSIEFDEIDFSAWTMFCSKNRRSSSNKP